MLEKQFRNIRPVVINEVTYRLVAHTLIIPVVINEVTYRLVAHTLIIHLRILSRSILILISLVW
jgi:hypothetical protein